MIQYNAFRVKVVSFPQWFWGVTARQWIYLLGYCFWWHNGYGEPRHWFLENRRPGYPLECCRGVLKNAPLSGLRIVSAYEVYGIAFFKAVPFHVVRMHENHPTFVEHTTISVVKPIDSGIELVMGADGHQ